MVRNNWAQNWTLLGVGIATSLGAAVAQQAAPHACIRGYAWAGVIALAAAACCASSLVQAQAQAHAASAQEKLATGAGKSFAAGFRLLSFGSIGALLFLAAILLRRGSDPGLLPAFAAALVGVSFTIFVGLLQPLRSFDKVWLCWHGLPKMLPWSNLLPRWLSVAARADEVRADPTSHQKHLMNAGVRPTASSDVLEKLRRELLWRRLGCYSVLAILYMLLALAMLSLTSPPPPSPTVAQLSPPPSPQPESGDSSSSGQNSPQDSPGGDKGSSGNTSSGGSSDGNREEKGGGGSSSSQDAAQTAGAGGSSEGKSSASNGQGGGSPGSANGGNGGTAQSSGGSSAPGDGTVPLPGNPGGTGGSGGASGLGVSANASGAGSSPVGESGRQARQAPGSSQDPSGGGTGRGESGPGGPERNQPTSSLAQSTGQPREGGGSSTTEARENPTGGGGKEAAAAAGPNTAGDPQTPGAQASAGSGKSSQKGRSEPAADAHPASRNLDTVTPPGLATFTPDLSQNPTVRRRDSKPGAGEPTEVGELMPGQRPGAAPAAALNQPLRGPRFSTPAPLLTPQQIIPESLGPWQRRPSPTSPSAR